MLRPIHFEIHAENPERARAFYTAVFGWKFSRWGKAEYWLATTGEKGTEGINGGIIKRKGPPPTDGAPVNAYVLTIDVPTFDEYAEKIKSAGGTQVGKKAISPKIGTFGYFKDTEGNIFCIIEMARS